MTTLSLGTLCSLVINLIFSDQSAACEIEKKIVREENELEESKNDSEDGVLEHSKEQECTAINLNLSS